MCGVCSSGEMAKVEERIWRPVLRAEALCGFGEREAPVSRGLLTCPRLAEAGALGEDGGGDQRKAFWEHRGQHAGL